MTTCRWRKLATYFITPDGRIVRRWTGLLTADKLRELLNELLAESGCSQGG